MKYMLLIYAEEKSLAGAEREKCYAESAQLCRDLDARGQYVSANPLQPVATATSVRVRNGKGVITDGPFAETREQLGGFFMVEAKDLNEALNIAAKIPGARWGRVGVRPVMEIPGLPMAKDNNPGESGNERRQDTQRRNIAGLHACARGVWRPRRS